MYRRVARSFCYSFKYAYIVSEAITYLIERNYWLVIFLLGCILFRCTLARDFRRQLAREHDVICASHRHGHSAFPQRFQLLPVQRAQLACQPRTLQHHRINLNCQTQCCIEVYNQSNVAFQCKAQLQSNRGQMLLQFARIDIPYQANQARPCAVTKAIQANPSERIGCDLTMLEIRFPFNAQRYCVLVRHSSNTQYSEQQ